MRGERKGERKWSSNKDLTYLYPHHSSTWATRRFGIGMNYFGREARINEGMVVGMGVMGNVEGDTIEGEEEEDIRAVDPAPLTKQEVEDIDRVVELIMGKDLGGGGEE